MDFIADNFEHFAIIGVVVWQVVQQIRSGNTALTSKMLADYKERNEQLEGIIRNEREASDKFKNDIDKIISDYKLEVARLRASNDEKDMHNKALKDLLQDKNPEVVNVLKEIRDYFRTTDDQNKKVLTYQTEILEELRDNGLRTKRKELAQI